MSGPPHIPVGSWTPWSRIVHSRSNPTLGTPQRTPTGDGAPLYLYIPLRTHPTVRLPVASARLHTLFLIKVCVLDDAAYLDPFLRLLKCGFRMTCFNWLRFVLCGIYWCVAIRAGTSHFFFRQPNTRPAGCKDKLSGINGRLLTWYSPFQKSRVIVVQLGTIRYPRLKRKTSSRAPTSVGRTYMTNVPRAAAEMGRAPATPTQQHKPAAKNNVVPRSESNPTVHSVCSARVWRRTGMRTR